MLRILIIFLVLLPFRAFADQSQFDLPMHPDTYEEGESIPDDPIDDPVEEEDPRDVPPPVLYGEEIDLESDSLIYVIDISCSMASDFQIHIDNGGNLTIGDRLERAKSELIRSINGLSENIKFNIIAFDCSIRLWAPLMVPANPIAKSLATSWAMSLFAAGGTGTSPAVASALLGDDGWLQSGMRPLPPARRVARADEKRPDDRAGPAPSREAGG